jgi:hypothetical protein
MSSAIEKKKEGGALEPAKKEASSERERVQQHADRIREELMLTLEELEKRRERAFDWRYQAQLHRDDLVKAGLAVVGMAAAVTGLLIWRARHRRHLVARRRWEGLKRAWEHPERLATGAQDRPFTVEMGEKLVTIFGGALATALARRSVQTLMDMRAAPAQAQGTGSAQRASGQKTRTFTARRSPGVGMQEGEGKPALH